MSEAGWYPDPYGDGTIQRYHDGAQWTGHTAPLATTSPPADDAAPVRRRPWAWYAIAVVLVLVLVAVGVLVSRRSSSSTADPASGAIDPPGPGWSAFLSRVPDFTTVENAFVQGADVATIRTQIGLDPHDRRLSGKAVEVSRLNVARIPTFWALDIEDRLELGGILPYEPDRSFEITSPPSVAIAVLQGNFDVAKITAALHQSPALGEDASVETYAGETYLRAQGEELKIDTSRRGTQLEPLKRPLRVLVAPDHILTSTTDDGMHKAIDAWAGRQGATNNPRVADAARALDEVKAVTLASPTSTKRSNLENARTTEPVPQSGAPASPLIGGVTLRDDRFGAYLVAVKDSEADATTAVANLNELAVNGRSFIDDTPWDEVLHDPKISSSGSVLIATFSADPAGVFVGALLKRENITDL